MNNPISDIPINSNTRQVINQHTIISNNNDGFVADSQSRPRAYPKSEEKPHAIHIANIQSHVEVLDPTSNEVIPKSAESQSENEQPSSTNDPNPSKIFKKVVKKVPRPTSTSIPPSIAPEIHPTGSFLPFLSLSDEENINSDSKHQSPSASKSPSINEPDDQFPHQLHSIEPPTTFEAPILDIQDIPRESMTLPDEQKAGEPNPDDQVPVDQNPDPSIEQIIPPSTSAGLPPESFHPETPAISPVAESPSLAEPSFEPSPDPPITHVEVAPGTTAVEISIVAHQDFSSPSNEPIPPPESQEEPSQPVESAVDDFMLVTVLTEADGNEPQEDPPQVVGSADDFLLVTVLTEADENEPPRPTPPPAEIETVFVTEYIETDMPPEPSPSPEPVEPPSDTEIQADQPPQVELESKPPALPEPTPEIEPEAPSQPVTPGTIESEAPTDAVPADASPIESEIAPADTILFVSESEAPIVSSHIEAAVESAAEKVSEALQTEVVDAQTEIESQIATPAPYPTKTPSPPEVMEHCNLPNTLIGPDGQCQCTPGYESDDPLRIGCWRCTEMCHHFAQCVSPGVCKCRRGFSGDGRSACWPPTPALVSITPEQCITEEQCVINATITVSGPADTFDKAYCKFGKWTVSSTYASNQLIVCSVPPIAATVVDVRVSFDMENWSVDSIPLTIATNPPRQISWMWPVIFFGAAFLVVFVLVYLLRSSDMDNREDREPLVISKARPHPGTEVTIHGPRMRQLIH